MFFLSFARIFFLNDIVNQITIPMKSQVTLLTVIFLLIFGVSHAQTSNKKKDRILDRAGKSHQVDQEALRNSVQITDFTKSNGMCTVLFSWTGDAGYTMSATMTYDPSQAVGGVVGAEGSAYGDFNHGVIDLVVSFFEPSGALMGTIVNVENGIVLYDTYLEISFNVNNEEFISYLDVGQFDDSPVVGDDNLNLWGKIGDWYDFFDESFSLDVSVSGFVVDVDDVTCEEPVAVPIANSTILLLILPMLGFMYFRSRFA